MNNQPTDPRKNGRGGHPSADNKIPRTKSEHRPHHPVHPPHTAPKGAAQGREYHHPQAKKGPPVVFVVWGALLAVLLLVIIIAASAGGRNAPPTVTTEATTLTESITTVTTEPPPSVTSAKEASATVGLPVSMSSSNGILIDRNTGLVLASTGGDSRIYPASMTKIMTLIVAYEQAESLDDTFVMTADITNPLYLANASVAGFLVGEEITVRDLIYGLMLPSGGDGALGLAYHIAGGEEQFAELMNEKAAELGLKNTHFTNCTGLHDDDHYSTCHEIAMILDYAIQNDFMRQVMSTYKYTTSSTPEHPEGILLTSTLFSRMYGNEAETAIVMGGKTGYTIEAKNCLATFATACYAGEDESAVAAREPDYILVTCGSGEKYGPVFDAIDIYSTFSEGVLEAPATGDAVTAAPEDGAESGDGDGGGVVIYTPAAPEE